MQASEVLNQVMQVLWPVLITFITGVATYLGAKIKSAYEHKIKNETAKTVVKDVVQFVEQIYGDLNGKDKLLKAIEQASKILESKGINITEAEINMLIESAVYGLNKGLGKEKEAALHRSGEVVLSEEESEGFKKLVEEKK